MKKILWKVGAGLFALSVLLFFLLACGGGQTKEANKLINKANDRVQKYNKLDQEVVSLANQIQALPITSEGASKGLELTKQVKEKISQGKEEIEAAKKELEKIKRLDVSDEFKTYSNMKVDELKLMTQLSDATNELVLELEKLFQQVAAGTATEASVGVINQNIDSISNKVDDLKKKTDELSKRAQDYYTEHKLGD